MCSRLAQQCNLKDRWYTLNSKLVIPGIKHEHWPALFFYSFEQWLQKQTSKPQRQHSFICRALNFHHSSLKIASKFPTASAYWFRHPSPVQIKTRRAWRRCFCSPPPFKRRGVSGWLPVCAMLVFERRVRCLLLVSPSMTKKINQSTESLMILSSAQQLENGKMGPSTAVWLMSFTTLPWILSHLSVIFSPLLLNTYSIFHLPQLISLSQRFFCNLIRNAEFQLQQDPFYAQAE